MDEKVLDVKSSVQRMRCTRQHIATSTFYQMPKFLFNAEFAKMSNDARVLYTIMRSRHELSMKNGWHDENGEVYIYFKREDMQAMLNLSEKTVTKIVKELKSFALMEEQRQGINKPNKIYLLAPVISNTEVYGTGTVEFTVPEPQVLPSEESDLTGVLHGIGENTDIIDTFENPHESRTRKNYGSGTVKSTGQDPQILRPSYKENKDDNNISFSVSSCHVISGGLSRPHGHDRHDMTDDFTRRKVEQYTALIKDNIGYDSEYEASDIALVDEFIAIIIDALFTESPTVRVGKEQKPKAIVENVLLKLNYWDIEHAINQFESVTHKIINKKQYILTLLYNCKLERDAHYINAYTAKCWEERDG